eukprot:640577-Rhodomonas_salina.1
MAAKKIGKDFHGVEFHTSSHVCIENGRVPAKDADICVLNGGVGWADRAARSLRGGQGAALAHDPRCAHSVLRHLPPHSASNISAPCLLVLFFLSESCSAIMALHTV